MKFKYFLFVFLLVCFACNKKSGVDNRTDNNSSGGGDDKIATDSVKSSESTLAVAVFTDVRMIAQGKPSNAIINYLTSLINNTPKGASIYLTIYTFKDEFGLMTAINSADERGVKVHIMLDRGSTDFNDLTIDKLIAMSKNIDIVGIYNNVKSKSYGKNHNKFALFSELSTKKGDYKNVVFTSSENWTPGTEKKIQDAVSLSNKGLYDAYLQYWKDMKLHADHKMASYNYREYKNLKDGIEAFFYPKRRNGSYFGQDPIVQILDQITNPSSTTIQIAMAFWTNDRISILNKLQYLMNQGAKVEIVVRSSVEIYGALEKLAKEGALVKMYNYTNVPNVKKIKMHSKLLLIRGEWGGHKTNIIVTGSENYNYSSLEISNNNNLLLSSYHFKHSEIFDQYEDYFNAIKVLPGVCCTTKH